MGADQHTITTRDAGTTAVASAEVGRVVKTNLPPHSHSKKTLPVRCPCAKKAKLKPVDGGYTCAAPNCYHSKASNAFPLLEGVPILISTRLCDTVCDPNQVRGADDSMPKLSLLRRLFYGQVQKGSKITDDNCRSFVRHLKALAKNRKPKVLVLGSKTKGSKTEALWDDPSIEVHGTDIDISTSVDVVCDGHYLPLASGAYDGVWIQQVLEHVVEPAKVVAEIHRVLRQGGIVYAETPFMLQVHSGAYDFTRFTLLGHRYLFRQFRLIDMGGNRGAEMALAWSLRYFIWAITRNRKLFSYAIGIELLMRPLRFLVSRASMYDSAADVYFLGSKSNKIEVTHKQLLGLYKGNYKNIGGF